MPRDGAVQLTLEGKEKLTEELKYLNEVRRPELSNRIQEANAHGDISDNSEYEDLKEELVMADARIHDLEQTLERAEIVEPPKGDFIGLGSTVTIVSDDGEEETWRVVGPEEADSRHGTISTQSPVGSALFGRKLGERTTVDTPVGSISYTVKAVG